MPHDIISRGLTNRMPILQRVLSGKLFAPFCLARGVQKLVLICYSGKTYAQAGTNVLSVIGANMDNVLTLEGGMKAWTGATEA